MAQCSLPVAPPDRQRLADLEQRFCGRQEEWVGPPQQKWDGCDWDQLRLSSERGLDWERLVYCMHGDTWQGSAQQRQWFARKALFMAAVWELECWVQEAGEGDWVMGVYSRRLPYATMGMHRLA